MQWKLNDLRCGWELPTKRTSLQPKRDPRVPSFVYSMVFASIFNLFLLMLYEKGTFLPAFMTENYAFNRNELRDALSGLNSNMCTVYTHEHTRTWTRLSKRFPWKFTYATALFLDVTWRLTSREKTAAAHQDWCSTYSHNFPSRIYRHRSVGVEATKVWLSAKRQVSWQRLSLLISPSRE